MLKKNKNYKQIYNKSNNRNNKKTPIKEENEKWYEKEEKITFVEGRLCDSCVLWLMIEKWKKWKAGEKGD